MPKQNKGSDFLEYEVVRTLLKPDNKMESKQMLSELSASCINCNKRLTPYLQS